MGISISAGIMAGTSRISGLYKSLSALKADGATVNETTYASEYNALHPTIKNQASLVLIPGAYKSGVIYGMNPNTGAIIPLSFARASTATRFNSLGVMVTEASGMPRVDYDPVTLAVKGYLFEKVSTNLLTYSEDFSNVTWVKGNLTVSANSTASVDGTIGADKLVETAVNAPHSLRTAFVSTIGTTYTLSAYLKKGERTWVTLWFDNESKGARFDLENGVIGITTGATATIENKGGGWYRCIVTVTATVTNASPAIYPMLDNATSSYLGDATKGLFVDRAQLEASSFATSYIPTVASQVTRVADACNTTNLAWYNQSEGTLYSEFVIQDGVDATSIAFTNATTGNIAIRKNGSNAPILLARSDAGNNDINLPSVTGNNKRKFAGVLKLNDTAFTHTGLLPLVNPVFTPPLITIVSFGSNQNNVAQVGLLKSLAYIPQRISNTELQAITV